MNGRADQFSINTNNEGVVGAGASDDAIRAWLHHADWISIPVGSTSGK
jgi:hypothetical protein